MKLLTPLLPVALALLAIPLRAEDPLFGGQLTLAQGQSDFGGGKWLYGRTGVAGGLHALFGLGYGHGLRVRADALFAPAGQINLINSYGSQMLYAERARTRILSGGIDYNFFYRGNHFEGPYAILGLAYSRAELSGAVQASGGVGPAISPWPASQRAGAYQWALGWGDRLSPLLGLEFRFTQANYKDLASSGTRVKAPILNLSLTMDF